MKLFRTAVLLSCLLLTGCIGENRDNCPPNNNLILRFSYTNDGGNEVFRERIQQTDLFFFDEAGYLVDRQIIGINQLDATQSIALSLKPGTYRLVSWGHQVARTGFSPLILNSSRLEEGYIYNNTLQSTAAATGDAWYFAPRASAEHVNGYFLTVPPTGTASQTLHFTSAHVRLEVYIEGFTDPDGNGGHHPPLIEINGLHTQVDFTKEPFGSLATYTQASSHETIEGTQLATAYFNLPPFKDDNSISVHIKKDNRTVLTTKADDAPVATVLLKDYLTTNSLSVENREEPVVPIYIKFEPGDDGTISEPGDDITINVAVTIGIPKWLETIVKPGV